MLSNRMIDTTTAETHTKSGRGKDKFCRGACGKRKIQTGERYYEMSVYSTNYKPRLFVDIATRCKACFEKLSMEVAA